MAEKVYNTQTLETHANKAAPENGGHGKAGLYRHPEAIDTATGELAEMITLSDPLFGEAQSNAAERLGFVRVGDAPEGAVKHLDAVSAAAASDKVDEMRGISARLAALEGVADRNKELEAQLEEYRKQGYNDTTATGTSGHDAKVAAADQTELRDIGKVDPGPAPDAGKPSLASGAPAAPVQPAPNPATDEDEEEPEDSEEPVKLTPQLNTDTLKQIAADEGVELTDKHDTKAKMREAIEAHRAESENE